MRDIGLPVKVPKEKCEDPRCPFHGKLRVRARVLEGTVISAKMKNVVIVGRGYLHYIPKYKRYERRRSSIPAYNPPCIGAKEGEKVRIAECRPLSKTVAFVVIEKIGR